MLIVLEPAYVNEGVGGPGAINMLIVPEAVFPYYSFIKVLSNTLQLFPK